MNEEKNTDASERPLDCVVMLQNEVESLKRLQKFYDREHCDLMNVIMNRTTRGQFTLWFEREPRLFAHIYSEMKRCIESKAGGNAT